MKKRRGGLPSTPIKKTQKDNFYPLQACKFCPMKWRGNIKDVKTGEVIEISCVDNCQYGRVFRRVL